jgi:hypothetical protein
VIDDQIHRHERVDLLRVLIGQLLSASASPPQRDGESHHSPRRNDAGPTPGVHAAMFHRLQISLLLH